jgi:hypothetical protein
MAANSGLEERASNYVVSPNAQWPLIHNTSVKLRGVIKNEQFSIVIVG